MKKLLLGILLLAGTGGSAFSQASTQVQPITQTAQDPVAAKKDMIARAHAALLKLPYPKDYLREVILAEVKQNRTVVAPHYPPREGATTAKVDEWITRYPQEVTDYLRLVSRTHRKYSLAKP